MKRLNNNDYKSLFESVQRMGQQLNEADTWRQLQNQGWKWDHGAKQWITPSGTYPGDIGIPGPPDDFFTDAMRKQDEIDARNRAKPTRISPKIPRGGWLGKFIRALGRGAGGALPIGPMDMAGSVDWYMKRERLRRRQLQAVPRELKPIEVATDYDPQMK